jgi:MFS family permease
MPNIVLPFFGGVLVDRFGPRRMLLCLTLLIFSGQSILAFGSSISNFKIMLVCPVIIASKKYL